MSITLVEIEYGLLAMVVIAVGLLVLLMLISGVHLLAREIGHGVRRGRARPNLRALRKPVGEEQLYARAD